MVTKSFLASRSTRTVMSSYVPPEFKKDDFHCPYCNVHATQYWLQLNRNTKSGIYVHNEYWVSACNNCDNVAIWYKGKMVYPIMRTAPPPNEDLPQEIKDDYNEARDIADRSPRAACALLRLCIEKICNEKVSGSGNLNEKIGKLVDQGLDSRIQRALDAVRVIGGQAIHSLVMDLKDDKDTAKSLFEVVNLVANWAYTQDKKISKIYDSLPGDKKKAIERRDSKK